MLYRVYPVFSIAESQHIIFQEPFGKQTSSFSHVLSEWWPSGGTLTSAACTVCQHRVHLSVGLQADATKSNVGASPHTPKSELSQ